MPTRHSRHAVRAYRSGMIALLALPWAGGLALTPRPAAAAELWGRVSAPAVAAGAPRFSSALRKDVSVLASAALAGRDNDTPGSRAAQRWISQRLRGVGRGLFREHSGDLGLRHEWSLDGQRGVNLVVTIPGREFPDEVVLVGAHYDHLDSRSDLGGHCGSRRAPGSAICPGATDNAAGTAVVLEIGRALRRLDVRPRRTVVLVLWDGEEDGLLGSRAWVANPPIPLEQTVAYVNFDIQGAEMLPSLVPITFALGAETGGPVLTAALDASIAPEKALEVQPLSVIFGQGRSDHAPLNAAGLPVLFFSDSTGPCYHTTGDDVSIVNFAKLVAQARVGFRTVVALAEGDARPELVRPELPIVHDDVVRLSGVVRRGLGDLALFPAGDHAELLGIGAQLEGIAARPAADFAFADAAEVGAATLRMIDAITALECRGRWSPAERGSLIDPR